jgi:hypothetical protein
MTSVRQRTKQALGAELNAMLVLSSQGWICGSRRHMFGAGDFLAVRPEALVSLPSGAQRPLHEVRLVEVKTTAQGPYERFGPQDRRLLLEAAKQYGAGAWLAWRPPGVSAEDWAWIPSALWPENTTTPLVKAGP